MRTGLLVSVVSAWLLVNTACATAQDWAKGLFNHTSFDFGVVDAGATATRRFSITNRYEENIHIASIRHSCNCTKPSLTKRLLKPQEQTQIEATLDTHNVKGPWQAVITVVFDRPFAAEVQLHLSAFVRAGVVVKPGEARFVSVEQGTPAIQALTISFTEHPNWRIVQVKTNSPYLEANAVERVRGQDLVSYEVTVHLKPNAPAGYLRDQLVLVTNELVANATQVPVAVEAMIVPATQVSPSPLFLGIVRPRESVSRNLVVRGKIPFRVLKLTGPDDRFTFQVPNRPKAVQLLPVTFKAEGTGGRIGGKIRIETDLAGTPILEVNVDGQIVPRTPAIPATRDARTAPAVQACRNRDEVMSRIPAPHYGPGYLTVCHGFDAASLLRTVLCCGRCGK